MEENRRKIKNQNGRKYEEEKNIACVYNICVKFSKNKMRNRKEKNSVKTMQKFFTIFYCSCREEGTK